MTQRATRIWDGLHARTQRPRDWRPFSSLFDTSESVDALNANDNRGRPCSLERGGGIFAKTLCIASITHARCHRQLTCWAVAAFHDPMVAKSAG